MISLGFSLKREDNSHCFVLQIKSAKSAGFGRKIHQRPDMLGLTKEFSEVGLLFCACFASTGNPYTNIPQIQSELLSDAGTTLGVGTTVVNFLLTFGNQRTGKPSRNLTNPVSSTGLTEVLHYPHLSLDWDPVKMQGKEVLRQTTVLKKLCK